MKIKNEGQLYFDFWNEKKNVELPKFKNPKNDNELLLNYQWEVKNGNKTAFTEMYELGVKIATRYINVFAKKNLHIAELSKSEKQEKAHNAITYIIERYYRVKDFFIKESFTSYIYLRIKHELFYKRKVDEIVQFVDIEKLRRIKQ